MIMVQGLVARLHKGERGQDVMEYALLAGFIGILLAVAFVAFPVDTAMENFAEAVGNCVDVTADPYICPSAPAAG